MMLSHGTKDFATVTLPFIGVSGGACIECRMILLTVCLRAAPIVYRVSASLMHCRWYLRQGRTGNSASEQKYC